MMTKFIEKSVKVGIIILAVFTCNSFSAQSQVTIGSDDTPLKGVLLDLKESSEVNGNANSNDGMVLPRVYLTNVDSLSPMLTASEPNYTTIKSRYTGLVVYNVNPNTPFEKGMYVWDGTQWNKLNTSQPISISVKNGLTLLNDSVKLGGDLTENTTINLHNYNLNLNAVQGRVGIGTANPQAVMQIENPNKIDPLILKNLLLDSDASNSIDNSSPAYYNLMISDSGVIRKETPVAAVGPNQTFEYNLNTNYQIAAGSGTDQGSQGNGGTVLQWTMNGSTPSPIITLPQAGAYVFYFNLYGTIGNILSSRNTMPTDAISYYISAYKNGNPSANTGLADLAEIVIIRSNGYNYASYPITLTVSGNAGDQIQFKISAYTSYATYFTWTLVGTTATNTASKTTMVYWKL